jgi:hypothetical protein
LMNFQIEVGPKPLSSHASFTVTVIGSRLFPAFRNALLATYLD